MATPLKPNLKKLRGDLTLSADLRNKLDIPDGILCGDMKSWKDYRNIVESFFNDCDTALTYGYEDFIAQINNSLQRLANYQSKDKEEKLISNYSARIYEYLNHPNVDERLKKIYRKLSRESVEKEEEQNLRREGRITALVVAQSESITLQEEEENNLVTPSSHSQPPINSCKRRNMEEASLSSSKHSKSEEFAKLKFFIPDHNKRYIINGFDVSESFYNFQQSLRNREDQFNIETHLHHVMALSSVLLLKPGRMHEDVVKIFGSDNLNILFNDTRARLDIKEESLPIQIITEVISIVQNLKSHMMNRNQAVIKLLSMEEEVNRQQFKVIKSISNIIAKVPTNKVMETIKENELCTRYLDPALCGLFDDPENETYFRWTNQRPSEDGIFTNERPDAVVSLLNGVKWSTSRGFGEAKCISEANNNYLISMDLFRLGIFSTSSIDTYSMKGVLSIQAVGNTVIFYITSRPYDSIYIMYEVAEITVPSCLDDVLKYLMDFSKLNGIVDLFERYCQVYTPTDESLSPPPAYGNIYALISPTSNRNRPCITKHDY